MRPRRILVLTYYFPPRPLIGSARWAAMSEWLRRLGHEVIVITSRFGQSVEQSESWVLRTFDVSAVGSVRALLGRGSVPETGKVEAVRKPTPTWFTDLVVPDEYLLTWGPSALVEMWRALRAQEVDCLITTGPPQSTHVLPLLLGRRRPPWVVDLRDGWRFDQVRDSWPTRAQDRLEVGIERRVLRSAEHVIGVTRPIALDAQSRLAVRSTYVPNGWDPERPAFQAQGGAQDAVAHLEHDRVNLVYTGTMSGVHGRDPRPVFEALRRLAARRPEAAARLRLVLAGTLTPAEQDMLSELDLEVPVEHRGSLPRDAAFRLQREADALLLLTSPTHGSEATGKLFEYLAAKRPILALASENDAARIVAETDTGVIVHPHDVDGIERALEAMADGTFGRSCAPCGLARYTYPALAEEVADIIEQAIARRRQSHAGLRA
jgi:glycosyltransferase involved in cell wall biosynthesis